MAIIVESVVVVLVLVVLLYTLIEYVHCTKFVWSFRTKTRKVNVAAF